MRAAAAAAGGIDPADVDMTNMEAFMIQDGRYIDASRDQMVADHGTVDAYIRDGLGLSDTEIRLLRAELVAPAP